MIIINGCPKIAYPSNVIITMQLGNGVALTVAIGLIETLLQSAQEESSSNLFM